MSSLRSQMSTAPASGVKGLHVFDAQWVGQGDHDELGEVRPLAGAHHRWANSATAMWPSSATVTVASSSG